MLSWLILGILVIGILQQFAISEATLLAWSSMDGESPRSGSNQGSVAHLSEVNQESITSRGRAMQMRTVYTVNEVGVFMI